MAEGWRGKQLSTLNSPTLKFAGSLHRHRLVQHREELREDGFVWEPPGRLDWLVCDIVDKPARVMAMIERWLLRRWCREAVFNLKLPMKRRWQASMKASTEGAMPAAASTGATIRTSSARRAARSRASTASTWR